MPFFLQDLPTRANRKEDENEDEQELQLALRLSFVLLDLALKLTLQDGTGVVSIKLLNISVTNVLFVRKGGLGMFSLGKHF